MRNLSELSFETREDILEMAGMGLIPQKFKYTDEALEKAWKRGEILTEDAYNSIIDDDHMWKIGQIQGAIAWGATVGFSPPESLKYVQFVKGNPSMSAEGMRHKMLEHGHELVVVESTRDACTMSARRQGSERWSTMTYDMQDAELAGLLQGFDKKRWEKHPMQMLVARCTAMLCRTLFPDTMQVFQYTPEEVEGFDDEGGRARRKPRQVEAAKQPESAEEYLENEMARNIAAAWADDPQGPPPPPPPPPAEKRGGLANSVAAKAQRIKDMAESPEAQAALQAALEADEEAHPAPEPEVDEVPPPPPPAETESSPSSAPEAEAAAPSPDEAKGSSPWRHVRPKNKAERADYAAQIRGCLVLVGAFTLEHCNARLEHHYGTSDLSKFKVKELDDLMGRWEELCDKLEAEHGADYAWASFLGAVTDPELTEETREFMRTNNAADPQYDLGRGDE